MRLDAVVLRCADLERSRLFYAALGLPLRAERHGKGPAHWSSAFGELVFELYPAGSKPTTSGLRLGLRGADVPAVVEAVRAVGVGAVLQASDTEALFEDPDGNTVSVVSSEHLG